MCFESVLFMLGIVFIIAHMQEQTTQWHMIEKRAVSVNHDEYESIAQAACTSMAIGQGLEGWNYAVERVCTPSNPSENCQVVCNSRSLHVQAVQTVGTWSCVGALQVYKPRPSSSSGTENAPSLGLKVFWSSDYQTGRGCGANFCCCHAADLN